MKRFLRRVLLFLLPPALVCALLFRFPFDKKFAYQYVKGDCDNRGGWLYPQMNSNSNGGIVFIGSSRTMNGVNDSLLEALLAQNGKAQPVLNLGYCRLGDNLWYSLVKDYLRRHHPKQIIFEVREEEAFGSHPVFPFLADAEDLISQPSWINQSYVSNFYDGWLMRLDYQRHHWLDLPDSASAASTARWGWRRGDIYADTNYLAQVKQKRIADSVSTMPLRNLNLRYPQAWLAQTVALAKAHGAEVKFLFLPEYGSPIKTPRETTFYQSFGELILPPDSIFTNPKHWKDDAHLNSEGAEALTRWLFRR